MESIASQLPPEVARQLHPDRLANEAGYWAARDHLLGEYRGRWVGFASGRVVAAGTSPVGVFAAAEATGLRPFLVCVGWEQEPCRVRRVTFPYDAGYPGEPLPVVEVEFRRTPGGPGLRLGRVIADTGADATVLPWGDCQNLRLDLSDGVQGLLGGLAGHAAATLSFLVWVHLDGSDHPCRLQADFSGSERILGRDVLNRLDVQFRGPAGEVVVGL